MSEPRSPTRITVSDTSRNVQYRVVRVEPAPLAEQIIEPPMLRIITVDSEAPAPESEQLSEPPVDAPLSPPSPQQQRAEFSPPSLPRDTSDAVSVALSRDVVRRLESLSELGPADAVQRLLHFYDEKFVQQKQSAPLVDFGDDALSPQASSMRRSAPRDGSHSPFANASGSSSAREFVRGSSFYVRAARISVSGASSWCDVDAHQTCVTFRFRRAVFIDHAVLYFPSDDFELRPCAVMLHCVLDGQPDAGFIFAGRCALGCGADNPTDLEAVVPLAPSVRSAVAVLAVRVTFEGSTPTARVVVADVGIAGQRADLS